MNFLKRLFYKISEYSYTMFKKHSSIMINEDENFIKFTFKKLVKNIKTFFFFSVHIILLQKYYVDSIQVFERKKLFDVIRMTFDEK